MPKEQCNADMSQAVDEDTCHEMGMRGRACTDCPMWGVPDEVDVSTIDFGHHWNVQGREDGK